MTGEAASGAVASLMEMGFPRDQVEFALRAAFNNPNRALDYLFNGIPDEVQAQMMEGSAPAGAGGNAGGNAGAGGIPEGGEMTEGEAFTAALRAMPPFTRLRYAVQQNPALMQPLLQQLGQTQPQLLQLISSHQDEFLALMNEPVSEEEMATASAATEEMNASMMGGMGGAGMGGAPGAPGAPPPGVNYVQVTEAERADIEQLETLGFPRHICVQAYFSCNKDPELAANFLLSYGSEMIADESNPPPQ